MFSNKNIDKRFIAELKKKITKFKISKTTGSNATTK